MRSLSRLILAAVVVALSTGATTGYIVSDGTAATGQVLVGNGTGIAGSSANLTYVSGQLKAIAPSAGTIPWLVKGAASQSANLTLWQDSTGATLGYVDPAGDHVAPGFLATSAATFATGIINSNITDSPSRGYSVLVVVPPSTNLPVFAWNDSGTLRTWACAAADCSTMGSAVAQDTGLYSLGAIGMALAPDGFPIISYGKNSTGDLRVAHCTSASCASTQQQIVVANGGAAQGSYTSGIMSFGSTMGLAYTSTQGGGHVAYVRCDNPTASTPCSTLGAGPTTILAGSLPSVFSLRAVLLGDGTPAFSMADYGRVIRCADSTCGTVSNTLVAASQTFTSMATNPVDGFATLVAIAGNGGGNTYVYHCTNASCSTSTSTQVTSGTGSGHSSASLVVPSSGNPVVLYGGPAASGVAGVRVLTCGTNNCSSFTSTTITSTDIADYTTEALALNTLGDAVGGYQLTGGDNWNIDVQLSSVSVTGTNMCSSGTRCANGYFSGVIKSGNIVVDGTQNGQGGISAVGTISSARDVVTGVTPSTVPMSVVAAASQSANVLEVRTSAGAALLTVDPVGITTATTFVSSANKNTAFSTVNGVLYATGSGVFQQSLAATFASTTGGLTIDETFDGATHPGLTVRNPSAGTSAMSEITLLNGTSSVTDFSILGYGGTNLSGTNAYGCQAHGGCLKVGGAGGFQLGVASGAGFRVVEGSPSSTPLLSMTAAYSEIDTAGLGIYTTGLLDIAPVGFTLRGSGGAIITTTGDFDIHNSGTLRLRGTANVSLDNIPSCSAGLQTNGSGVLSCIVSDARFKDVQPRAVPGLSAIQQIHPVTYRWKSGADKDDLLHVGFLAQDVERAIPDATHPLPDGTLVLEDRAITASLVKAVQELSARVEALEAAKRDPWAGFKGDVVVWPFDITRPTAPPQIGPEYSETSILLGGE